MDKKIIDEVNLSLGRCLLNEKAFMKSFYENFLGSNPNFKSMFENTDMEKQYSLLKNGLTFLLMAASGSRFANREIDKLGLLHDKTNLNIDPGLYPLWIKALIKTVKEYDKDLNLELSGKWELVLNDSIKKMTDVYQNKP